MDNLSNKNNLIFLSQPETVSMADEWFEIASKDHFWMTWRFNVLFKKLKSVLGEDIYNSKCLEIGCGHGQFLQQIESKAGVVADGCDLNTYALNKIENVKGKIYVYDIFQKHDDLQNAYDIVFLLDVIEHIDDDRKFVEAALSHVKPGGVVVINVPALQSLYSKYDTVAGHKRRYHTDSMNALLRAAGITPRYVGYWGFSLLPIALLRKIYLKMISSDRVIQSGFATSGTMNSLFKVLMKIELLLFKNPSIGTSVIAIGQKSK